MVRLIVIGALLLFLITTCIGIALIYRIIKRWKFFNNQRSTVSEEYDIGFDETDEHTYTINHNGKLYTFLRINQDPTIDQDHVHPNAYIKTKICRNVESSIVSFCREYLNLSYAIPFTHSTRLIDQYGKIPRNASYIAPHGIAAYADWAVISATDRGDILGIFGTTIYPKTIYLHTNSLSQFTRYILPYLQKKFILITACNDYTIPVNIDSRYDNDARKVAAWDKLVASPLLIHWFAENKCTLHKKVSSLPIGASLASESPDYDDYPVNLLPLANRTAKIFVGDKVHVDESSQWDDRARMFELCKLRRQVCYALYESSPNYVFHPEWAKQVAQYQFIACTHGGGLDTSPKSWEAIRLGTIPIIEMSPLHDAYKVFPIAWVRNLTEFMMLPENSIRQQMEVWVRDFGPFYEESSHFRRATLAKLTTKFWHNHILSYFDHSVI